MPPRVLWLTGLILGAFVADVETLRAEPPWRAWSALDGPAWLDVQLSQRTRFEGISADPRAEQGSDPRGLMSRTLLRAELRRPMVEGALEIQDARAFATAATPRSTGLVNTLEPIEAWLGVRLRGVFSEGDTLELRAGRMTLDMGSRRFLARNEFRNTTNGFNILSAAWSSAARVSLSAFGGVPVVRLPSTPEALADNAFELDAEGTSAWIFGAFAEHPELGAAFEGQLLALGLLERGDGS